MFWACFSGSKKGPCLFWEKDWGTINKESYCERIVSLVHGWMRMSPGLLFMQDNASGHAAQYTLDELLERDIHVINWPPYSPDLNPIEKVWDWMKDWIQDHYSHADKLSYDALRKAVREAWDAVTPELLNQLIEEMSARCQAVIDAEGGPIKY